MWLLRRRAHRPGAARRLVDSHPWWALDLRQDDLAWVALTMEIDDVIRAMTVTVMAEYGTEVSVEKRLEDEAVVDGPQPNPVVLFIGGLFDMMDIDNLVRGAFMRAQEKTLARFGTVVNEWEKYPPGKLAPRDLTETTIGMSSSMGALVYAYDDASTAAFGCFAGAAVQTWQSAGVEVGPCVNLGGVQGATRSGFGA